MEINRRVSIYKGCSFINDGLGLGEVMTFDENHLFRQHERHEMMSIINRIEQIKGEEIEQYLDVVNSEYHDPKLINLFSLFIFNAFNMFYLKQKVRRGIAKKRLIFPKYFYQGIEDNLKKMQFSKKVLGNDDRDEALEHIEKLKERIIHRLIFDSYKSKIQSIEKDVILRVNAFRAEYLDELPINLQGIIYKTTDIDERFMRIIAQEFQIPTVQTTLKIQDSSQIILDGKSNKIIINPNEVDLNEFSRLEKAHYFQIGDHPTYKPSKVEVYASMAHRKHIEKALSSNWYKGIAPFKTEYMFLTKGRIPTEYEQYVIFKDLFRRSQGRPVYVRIPDFREDKPIGHMKGVTTDMNSFADNSLIFSRHLNAIARAAHEENPDLRMVLPMIRMNDEIEFWKWQIWSSYSSHQMRVPDVGITVETESALQYFEEYDYLNFVLIGLNDLTEEVSDDCDRFSELTVKKFKEIFHPDLRDLHQHYRRKNKITKHIIGGNVLHNPSIFRELLKWGFRNFSIPVDKIKRIEPVITHYNETRGRFIGVAEERKRKIQEKTLEKQKSITLNK